MKFLTRMAMAVFGIQWLLPTQLVPDLPTMATGFISSMEIWIVVMHFVGGSMFPRVLLAVRITIVTIVTVGAVGSGVFDHCRACGVVLKLPHARSNAKGSGDS